VVVSYCFFLSSAASFGFFFFFLSFCYRRSKDLGRSKEDKKEQTEVGKKQEPKKSGEN
jgi:hypothetical protein